MCAERRASIWEIHQICNRGLYAKIWGDWVGVLHIYPSKLCPHLPPLDLSAAMQTHYTLMQPILAARSCNHGAEKQILCEGFNPLCCWIGYVVMGSTAWSDTWWGDRIRMKGGSNTHWLDRIRFGGWDTSVWIGYGYGGSDTTCLKIKKFIYNTNLTKG